MDITRFFWLLMLVLFLFSCTTYTRGYVLKQTRPLYPSIRTIDSEYKVILLNKEMEFQNYSITSDSKFKTISALQLQNQGTFVYNQDTIKCISSDENSTIYRYVFLNKDTNSEKLVRIDQLVDSTEQLMFYIQNRNTGESKLESRSIKRIEEFILKIPSAGL